MAKKKTKDAPVPSVSHSGDSTLPWGESLRPSQRDILSILLLVFLTWVFFHRALDSGMVYWDDDVFINRNEILKMDFWDAIKTTFSTYFHGDYLPLTIMSYWVDVQLFGQNWTALHVSNLIFHSANVALVYLFISRFEKSWIWAFFIALIFAFHPLQAEPVVWISERKSLVSGFLTLLSLFLYLRFIQEGRKTFLAFALVCYLLGILAKTTAILLPLLFFLLDRFYAKKGWKECLVRLVPAVILIGLFSVLRTISYDYSTPGVVDSLWNVNRLKMVPSMAFSAIAFYVEKFFWPENLSAVYDYFFPTAINHTKAIVAALGLLSVTAYFLKRRAFAPLFYLSLFFLFLLPVLHLIPRANFVNDRYMYLPIIGFSGLCLHLLKDLCIRWALDFERTVLAVCLLIVLPMGLWAREQSRIWVNNLVFWEHTVQYNPTNILARNALGLEYHERKRYDESRQQFEYVLAMPTIPVSLKLKSINNLANVYTDRNYPGFNPPRAVELYEVGWKGAERRNLTYELRLNLAQTYYLMNQPQKGIEIATQVYKELQTEPDSRNRWLIPFIEKMLGGKPPTN